MTKLKISQKNEGTAYLVHSNDWNKILNTARLAGYNNEYHFIRQFKQITGITPGKAAAVND